MQIPLLKSHILADPSKEPVKTLSPSVVNDNEIISPWWPDKSINIFPYSKSHNLQVLSIEPVARTCSWGSKDKQTISSSCPTNVVKQFPYKSQIFAVLSNDPVAILSP